MKEKQPQKYRSRKIDFDIPEDIHFKPARRHLTIILSNL